MTVSRASAFPVLAAPARSRVSGKYSGRVARQGGGKVLRRSAVAGICGLAIVLPSLAAAQLQLRRPTPAVKAPAAADTPKPSNVPARPSPAAEAPAPAGVTVAPRPLDDAAITVNRLESVDPDAIGLIGESQGGFGLNLWRGAQWPLVRGLMPRIPAGNRSTVLRELAQRLLISQASVPEGKPLNASFVALRVNRLLASGDVANALALLKMTPDERRDEALSQTRIEALFFNNNNSGACNAIRNDASAYSGLYWSQVQAFCLALSGEHARASLIADLLRERESEMEPLFFAAIDALAGSKTDQAPALKSPTALHLAMMRAAGFRFPAEIVQTGEASVLRAVALTPNADLDTRLIAAERAHRIGALSAEEIVRFYLGIPFSREELTGPISAAEETWSPRTRALLLRAASSQTVALAKAEVLRRAWELGRERDGYDEISGASVSVVAGIDPAAELIWFARDAARVLFGAGRIEKGLGWYAVAAADAERIDEARAAEADLWPIAVLAQGARAAANAEDRERQDREPEDQSSEDQVSEDRVSEDREPEGREAVPFTVERLRKWFDARRQADPQKARPQAIAFFTLLETVGRKLPQDLWHAVLDGSFATAETALNAAWERRLAAASTDGRAGETVLLTVVGAGDSVNGELVLSDAVRAIAALRRLGLTEEASRLAVEAAMAAGL